MGYSSATSSANPQIVFNFCFEIKSRLRTLFLEIYLSFLFEKKVWDDNTATEIKAHRGDSGGQYLNVYKTMQTYLVVFTTF